jgi:hypothetical protein
MGQEAIRHAWRAAARRRCIRRLTLATILVAGCGDDGATTSGRGGGSGGGSPSSSSSISASSSGVGAGTSSSSGSSTSAASSGGDDGAGGSGGGGAGGSAGGSPGDVACAEPNAAETCATSEDDDCDGTECSTWSHAYAGPMRERLVSSAATRDGDVYFIGDLVDESSRIQFGGETISADASHAMFLAKVSASGEDLWIRRLPTEGVFVSYQIVATSDGGVVLSRSLEQEADLGGGPIAPVGDEDVAFVRYAADGTHEWEKVLRATPGGVARVRSSGQNPAGQILFFGEATPGATYGGETITNGTEGAERSIFSLLLDPHDGSVVWTHELPIGEAAQDDLDIGHPTFDADGNFAVVGFYRGAAPDFGDGPLPYDGDGEAYESYVARFDAAGELVSARRICRGDCYVAGAAMTATGEIYASAVGRAPSTLGDGIAFEGQQGFIFELTTDDEVAWSIAYDTAIPASGFYMPETGVDASGDLTFTIPYQGRLDLEGETIDAVTFEAQGEWDLLLGKLHQGGSLGWARSLGSQGSNVSPAWDRSLAVHADGTSTIAFTFVASALDVGSGRLSSSAMTDMAVARFAP